MTCLSSSMRFRATGALLLLSVATAAGCGGSGHPGADERARVAARLAMQAEPLVVEDLRRASTLALISDHLAPNAQGELAMLGLAAREADLERVISAHAGPVTAVASLDTAVVSAGRDRTLKVWDRRTGELLARRELDAPVVQLHGTPDIADIAIGADANGDVALWDLADPRSPDARILAPRQHHTAPPVGLGFGSGGSVALAVWPDGTIDRWDVADGARLKGLKIADASGNVPWPPGSTPALTAATFVENLYGPGPVVVAGTAQGAVVRVNLQTLRARTAVRPGQVEGRIRNLAVSPYGGDPVLIAGTSRGFAVKHSSSYFENRPDAPGVAAYGNDAFLVGNGSGVQRLAQYDGGDSKIARPGATAIAASPRTPVIGHVDGTLSLLRAAKGAAIALPFEADTAIARFAPDGTMLIADGYDANHVSKLVRVRLGHRDAARDREYQEVRAFKPASSWWPQGNDDSDNWYVNEVADDGRFLAAAGHDPTGTASVLVWDAHSGRPVRRLPLTTGGVTPGAPALVTSVRFVPDHEMLAAYSLVQESVVLWSTRDWRRLATVHVGPAGTFDVMPDGSRIVVAVLPERSATSDSGVNVGAAKGPSQLTFVDVDRGAVDHVVRTHDTSRVAVAPDGHAIATVDAGRLRVVTTDGRRDLVRPIGIDAPTVGDLEWRPDSRVVAVSRSDGGTVIVDPATRAVASPLMPASGHVPVTLSWSPSGQVLAAGNADPAEDGEGFDAAAPDIWRLDRGTLRERTCALAGGPVTSVTWARAVHGAAPAQHLCATRRAIAPRAPKAPVIAFRRDVRLFAAGRDGRQTLIGAVSDAAYAPQGFVWSNGGALGWASDGRAHLAVAGRLRSWPCACSAVTFDGETLTAVTKDGAEVLRFQAGGPTPVRRPLQGAPSVSARVLAAHGRDVLVTGFFSPPDRATPTAIARLHAGRAVFRGLAGQGDVSSSAVASPDGRHLAFRVSGSGGACYPMDTVMVVDARTGHARTVDLPPDVGDPHIIRSLYWPANGELGAVVAGAECPIDGDWPKDAPQGAVLQSDGQSFERTGERIFDVARGSGDLTARIRRASFANTPSGTLTLMTPSRPPIAVADDVSTFSVRP